ncbi:MAG: regulatory protein RecX [Fusobacteriaceae bacterium]
MMIYYKISRNKVSFENGVEFTLSGDIISRFNLKKKEFLENDEYILLLEIACENYAYYLLGIKNYFKRDLYIKLQERYRNSDVVLKILGKILEKGYIDDNDSAKNFILNHGNYGVEKLRFHLIKKGVSKEVIEELLEESRDSQLEQLRKMVIKMQDKPKEKVIESLMRKGFAYRDIKEILEENRC